MPAHLKVPYRIEQDWSMSSARIRNELGYFEPVDSNTAMARTIAWERVNPPELSLAAFDYAAEDQAI
jgi:hypothetical protein